MRGTPCVRFAAGCSAEWMGYRQRNESPVIENLDQLYLTQQS